MLVFRIVRSYQRQIQAQRCFFFFFFFKFLFHFFFFFFFLGGGGGGGGGVKGQNLTQMKNNVKKSMSLTFQGRG